MANLTQNTSVSGRLDGRTAECLIANTVTLYEGELVCINATGFAVKAVDTANFKFYGIAIKGGTGDGTTVTCVVERRGTRWLPKASTAQADMGKLAYVVDSGTVGVSATTNIGNVGRIVGINTANNLVEVDLEDRVA